jgi:metal-responsive CopG/Arc/MetJ family transcriptional regulator
VRVNISMDSTLLDAVDRAADAAGQSRSAYLAEAVRERIRRAG